MKVGVNRVVLCPRSLFKKDVLNLETIDVFIGIFTVGSILKVN